MRHSLVLIALVSGIGILASGCSSDSDAADAPTATTAAAPATTVVETATTAAPGTVHVQFTKEGPLPALGTPFCDAAQHCVIPGTETGTITGDFEGTNIMAGATAVDGTATNFASVRLETFVGTMKECGEGTFVTRSTEDANATSGTGAGDIVPGYGTGDLVNMTGHFEGKGGVVNGVIQSTYTGDIDCGN